MVAKLFFNWCVGREYCAINPLEMFPKPELANTRDRVLDDGKIRLIWSAVGTMRRQGEFVKSLICTGKQAGQIARMHESWIDKDNRMINFPAAAMRNKLAHTIPNGALFQTAFALNEPVESWMFAPPDMPGVDFSA